MEITFRSISEADFDSIFSTVKNGLFHHVDAVFGWDDHFQRRRLETEYQHDWFYWIEVGDQQVGLVCFKPYDNSLHVHLLIIDARYRGNGIGSKAMHAIHAIALSQHRKNVTLSSFRGNGSALSFYQNLGYRIIDNSEKNFVSLSIDLAL
ncbi:GNAT family N-acetyltransferase [Vibrio sp. 10N.261.51.F12]|uniref:GNAT family N-acetyltransferase n=1 Tax=Vibrio sp. 10N.261.51.F12 TaxID=3229679 RepID=UPI00354B496B